MFRNEYSSRTNQMKQNFKKFCSSIFIFPIACFFYGATANNSLNAFNQTINHSSGFTENKGQIFGYDGLPHPEVKYVFEDGATQIFLMETGLTYQFKKVHYPKGYKDLMNDKGQIRDPEKMLEIQKQIRTETFRMDMTLVGANSHCEIRTEGKSLDYANFYNRDALDVHTYTKIIYRNVYPGIDWVVYSNDGGIKYDFVVHPNADPSLIKMQFDHQEDLRLNRDGSFALENSMGSIREEKPMSFQEGKSILSKFILHNNILSFEIDSYQTNKELIIDPALLWSTYYGNVGGDFGLSCATDLAGNVYLAGLTTSSTGIASGGHQNTWGTNSFDAFLVKFNSAGVRQWGTYYGGNGADEAFSCSTDGSGNVYLAGVTNSTNNIASGGHQNTIGGGQTDAFLVKFNSAGVRQWGTYYGGAGNDHAYSCSTDNSGNIYLAGTTTSGVDISSGGHQNSIGGSDDAFLIKFNGAGVRQWGTYYGGSGNDRGRSSSVDANGNVYLAGNTDSGNAIASGGFQNTSSGLNEGFLVKFLSNGVRLWGTYYGGISDDYGNSCATDVAGNVYLAGSTTSSTGIASGGHQNNLAGPLPGSSDAYLVKFNGAGIRLWGTYYGGNGGLDGGSSCVTDAAGYVYLAGVTNSSVGIGFAGYKNVFGGNRDAFLVRFDAFGVRQWGTYFGNSGFNGNGDDLGHATSVDAAGNVYLAGETTSTAGIASGGHQNSSGGGIYPDAFLAKFCNTPAQPSAISGNTLVCLGSSHTYSVALDPGVNSYSWSLPGAGWTGISTTNTISLSVGSVGSLSVTSSNTCGASALQSLSVGVLPSPTLLVNSGTICVGQSFTINPTGGSTYTFSSGSAIVSPTIASQYSVTGTSSAGCTSQSAAVSMVSVISPPLISVNSGSVCKGESYTITPSGASTYTFSNGSPIVTPSVTSSYSVIGTNSAGCVSSISAVSTITVFSLPDLLLTSTNTLLCLGESATLQVTGANTFTWVTGSFGNSLVITPTATSSYSLVGIDGNGCMNSASITQGVVFCNGITQHLKNNFQAKIYPNPNNGEFIVQHPFTGKTHLTVYDASGRKILNIICNEQKVPLDISEQADGIYYLEISNEFDNKYYLKLSKN